MTYIKTKPIAKFFKIHCNLCGKIRKVPLQIQTGIFGIRFCSRKCLVKHGYLMGLYDAQKKELQKQRHARWWDKIGRENQRKWRAKKLEAAKKKYHGVLRKHPEIIYMFRKS